MNKIEEILRSHYSNREVEALECQFKLFEMVAHEYAEYYCNQYREMIINNCSNYDGMQIIEQEHLKELKLPEHE